MSRDTDSSPYPPDGGRGGGAAYPSGTPAYGTGNPQYGGSTPSGHPQSGASRDGSADRQPDEEPKTETTITTRVRINIPGSRPIPPVVLRTQAPEGDGAGAGAPGGASEGNAERPAALPPGWEVPAGGAAPVAGPAVGASQAAAAPAGASAPGGATDAGAKPTSDWFAPRKAAAPRPSGAGPEATGQHALPGMTQGHMATAGAALPEGGGPSPFAPGQPLPDAAGGRRTAAQEAAGMGSPQPHPGGAQAAPAYSKNPYATDQYPGRPYTDGPGQGGVPGPQDPGHGTGGAPTGGRPGGEPGGGPSYQPQAQPPHDRPQLPGADQGGVPFTGYRPPSGPTTGPATGDLMMQGGAPSLYTSPQQDRPPAQPQPQTYPGAGDPAPVPSAGYRPASDELSSDTLVSGIPAVQPDPVDEPRPVPPAAAADSDDEYRFEDDEDTRGGGRSKLILATLLLLGIVGVGYGAGLLMDHADVPKGTTVLGIDIGGKSKPEAVQMLDAELGRRAIMPIPVLVGVDKARVDPRVAGLDIDTTATVRDVAHRDYNPVSVIGSLFGGERKADAAFVVDEDKLRVALKTLGDKLGGAAAQDGTVKFIGGKPVGVPGKVHLTLDVDRAVDAVRDAYVARAGSGTNPVLKLSRTEQKPTIGQAEIDRAIEEFGETAMSGIVTIKAGDVSIPFSPERSLSKFLSMRPVNGKLEPYFDLKVLQSLYGGSFDGLTVNHGGSTGPITPRDVAATMLPLLKETDPNKRIGVMEVVE